ncbi:APC family permease [Actinomycetospora chibensis]|uniref:APC family permease n=1 Tax=Actinomycetospora chibensis TaxID=663606 RepID=A0ABV9RLS2_9PSEU|nr:APC family permease [Actinomycetospora chibensis]MDD7925961.1 APC family permease [Actinomycetospora chibensis]
MTRIPVLRSRSPVAGLRRRSLRPPGVFAQSVATTAPAGAMASTPLLVIAAAGNGALWSFAIAAVVVGLVAACITVFARRMAAAGGLYSFTAQGLGPGGAYACAVAMVVGYGMLVAVTFAGVSWYGGALVARLAGGGDAFAAGVGVALVVVLAITVAVGAVRGVRLAGRVMLVIEAVSIGLILVVLVALALTTAPGTPPAPVGAGSGSGLGGPGLGGIAVGVLPALAAFIGFDSAASLGVEARRPFASIPRAITTTAAVAAVLYLVATLVQLATPGGAGRATSPTSGVPATVGDLSWASVGMDVGIVASFGACALAALNTLVRVLFSLAREGVAPAALGRTHRRHLTPAVAVWVTVPVPAAVVVVGTAAGVAPATVFGGLVAVATLGFLAAYLLVCLAAPRFLARIGELTGGVVVASVLASAALVATVVVVVLHASAGLLITLAGLLVLGAGGWVVLRRRRGAALRGMGVYDETTTADVLAAGPR